MKYADLPKADLIEKLMATSFDKPSANRAVFDWGTQAMENVRFIENERVKLVKRLGEDDGNGNFSVPRKSQEEFFKRFNEVLQTELPAGTLQCPVEPDWFDDGRCCYPREKELWISPKEIAWIMGQKEKQGE